jgi:hypothetical protein
MNNTSGVSTTLNVTSWQEDELQWRGTERRAFDGTILSTLRAPKRQIQATVEFTSGAALDALQLLVATGMEPGVNRIASLAPCSVSSGTGFNTSNASMRGASGFTAYIHLGQKTPWFYEEAGSMKTGWRVDLDIRQI